MLPACLTASGFKILLIACNSHNLFYCIATAEIEYELEYVKE